MKETWRIRDWGLVSPDATNPNSAQWIALAVIGAVTGVGLSFVAWSSASAALGVWAAALLLAAPGIAVLGTPGRRECEQAEAPASPEVMGRRLRQAELALKIIRAARAVVLIAQSYLAILWLCELGDLSSSDGFLLPYTGLCLAALAAYLPWLAPREQRVMALAETRRAQLEAFKRSRDWLPDRAERKSRCGVL